MNRWAVAALIRLGIDVGFGAMFHRSLAVENLLKGLLAGREPELSVKGNPKRLYEWGHDIRVLSASAHIDLQPHERMPSLTI